MAFQNENPPSGESGLGNVDLRAANDTPRNSKPLSQNQPLKHLAVKLHALDNALDAAEEAGESPVVKITVSDDGIAVTDNGPGIAPETVANILDYTSRTSSREAYVSPTRGAQGNALKTLLAMPFALDGERGETMIESRGVAKIGGGP